MADEKKKKNCCTRFFANTSFVGFKEVYESQSVCWKVLWAVCIVLCTVLTVYQLYGLFSNYVDQPTVTIIKTLSKDYEFPQILFGYHTDFALNDTERARILGLDKQGNESFEFLKSFFFDDPDNNYEYSGRPFNISKARQHLMNVMKKRNYTHVAQIYKAMVTTDRLPVTTVVSGGVTIVRVSGNDGCIYYLVSLNGTDSKKGQAKKVQLSYEEYESGFVVAWLNPYDDVEEIHMNMNTEVDYKLSKTLKLSTAKKPCRSDKTNDFNYNVENCQMECAQKRWRQMRPEYPCTNWEQKLWIFGGGEDDSIKCTPGIVFTSRNDTDDAVGEGCLDGYFNETLANEFNATADTLLNNCEKDCILPCEQWIVDTRITKKKMEGDEGPTLQIEYPSAALVLVLEETYTFGWESFVGNVGGILGLWLGANLLSILQAVYLFMGDRDLVERSKIEKLAENLKREIQEMHKKDDDVKSPTEVIPVKRNQQ